MHWYLVFTKPRQENCALQNLEQQGYQCYLPMLRAERLRQGSIEVGSEPLFPRYLFIRLGEGLSAKSWSPIRSTRGVSRLVTFGADPAKVDDALVDHLKSREARLTLEPQPLFSSGERVRITDGALSGIEGIFQTSDGERRAMILIELLSKPSVIRISPASLRKVG